MKTRDYETFHQKLADKLNISPRDVRFFRNLYFNGYSNKELIAPKIQNKLPRLRKGKSWRYEVYLKRLSFLAKISDEDFKLLMTEYHND